MPRVWRAAAAQNRRDGTNYPVPPIFCMDESSTEFGKLLPNVVLALVTEIDGRVRQGHVWLRSVEEMSFGGGREAMAFSALHIPMALQMLRERGYDALHIFPPHLRVGDLDEMLRGHGMRRIDDKLAHYFRTL